MPEKLENNAALILNQRQEEAVSHRDGPAVVVAGPGTGKTRIIVERVARLVEDYSTLPGGIFVVTFTKKAAGELHERIALRLGDEDASQIQVSTLHSLALRICRAAAKNKGMGMYDVIIDDDTYKFLKRAMREEWSTPEMQQYFSVYPELHVYRTLQAWKTGDRNEEVLDPPVRKVLRRYQNILQAEQKWDIADLIINAIKSLDDDESLQTVFSTSVDFLMVDEFQDTAMTEMELLLRILNGNNNMMVVKANAQWIYRWRGVDSNKVQKRFEDLYPDRRTFILRNNYRNRERIGQVAASIMPEEREVWLTPEKTGGQVFLHETVNNIAESNLVASIIKELNERDEMPYRDFAILYRTWSQSGALEQALLEYGIPYELSSEKERYYNRVEVRAMLSYLIAIKSLKTYEGEDDNSSRRSKPVMDGALNMIINTPPRGIGPRSIRSIQGKNPEIGWPDLLSASVPGARVHGKTALREQVSEAVGELLNLLTRMARLSDDLGPDELIAKIIRDTKWGEWLENELDGRSMLRYLRTFQEEAAEYDSLEAFVDTMRGKVKSLSEEKGVALSTIHGAKGLEWPVVFVVGFNQGILPLSQSLKAGRESLTDERRLAHVAFSRACDVLFITWVRDKISPDGRSISLKKSEFAGLIPQEFSNEYESTRSIVIPNGGRSLEDGERDAAGGEGRTAVFEPPF